MTIGLRLSMLTVLLVVLISCKKDTVPTAPAPVPVITPGKSYFVADNTGSDANTGLSPATAFKSIIAGVNAAAPGDTVFVMTGIYKTPLSITKSGKENALITIKAYPSQLPKVFISGDVWNGLSINGSYLVIDGLEFQGDNASLDYDDAFAAYTASVGGAVPQAKYNTNAISIGGPNTTSKFPHHVTVRNCRVHDFPGGGIGSIQADYTTIENNTVYNNAWYMMYGGSGIGILTPFNSDAPDITKYKNIVRNNVCYNNKTTVPWIGIKALSDGNGIIMDVNQTGYNGTGGPYTGRTLVENNISFNNGGSGIHSYKADHTDIINNTAYGNGTIVGYADIFAGAANDVKIANNIMYARTGGKCNTAPGTSTVTYDYNIYFNGAVAIQGLHDKIVNPQFINAATDGSVANFRLAAGSPAIDAGTTIIYSKNDITGLPRPQGGGVDCGAYEMK